ncbi:MAG: uroporphyrinogen-III synthase [Rhizobiales bacterium]|nr:uroporphyrinogen-III synthase [Hyphomicrobiales bacterium]
MAVLVTRPAPDNEKTAKVLAARGFEPLLSPTLRFEAMPFYDDHGAAYDGVILTSANAVRALRDHEFNSRLVNLPSFAVGEHTAETARQAGFTNIIAAKGDAGVLRDVIAKSAASKVIRKGATLCYIAGADLARDLAAELGQLGFTVITHTAYRMIPVETLPGETAEAFRTGVIQAVLHFSRRSACAFVAAARSGGVEVSALALPQYCISDAVGMILRDAGATQVTIASAPNEDALIGTLAEGLKRP